MDSQLERPAPHVGSEALDGQRVDRLPRLAAESRFLPAPLLQPRCARTHESDCGRSSGAIGSKCAFCEEWLVLHYRDVPGRVLSVDHQEVTWRASDGTVVKSLIATVEHMIPVTQGGSNDLSNLRLSCFPCNARRAGHNPAEPRHHSECIHELEVGWHCHASCAVRGLQGNLL